MKDELHTENIDVNPFEAPANLWDRVEAGLNEKRTKRRGVIWWSVAAGIALLGGLGYTMITFLSNNSVVQKNWNAKTELPIIQEDSIQEKVDTSDSGKEYTFPKIKPLANDTAAVELETVTTAVPFIKIAPQQTDPNAISYTWNNRAQNPFGTGGTGAGTGGGNGTGFGKDPSSGTTRRIHKITAPPSASINQKISTEGFNGTFGLAPQTNWNGNSVQKMYNSHGAFDLNGTYIVNTQTKKVIPYNKINEGIGRYYGDSISFDFGEFDLGYDQLSSPQYARIQENTFKPTSDDPLSTFSIDVDGASYSDVRGMINRNNLPNPNAVRLEEFINYFPYDYAEPTGEHPFSINTEMAACPWDTSHRLLKIGIKGESIDKAQLPKNNLVFLLDVSGSMDDPEKLELLKKGFRLLVNELREEDRVAIAVYAGAAGLVLPPTSGENKDQILDALNNLSAGGSTAGGEGINLAYATAEDYFDPKGNNRIILATDGDFNVGVSDNDALIELIEEKRKSGVFLTVLGFGHDNFQSDKMEKIANNGNGNFSFIDNILEAKKVLVTEMGATLKTIAKDVKIQIEFNPEYVSSYRLLGYENRMLEHQDFANDTIDAGELGAGHTVTAVYEIIPPGAEDANDLNDDGTELKYSKVEKSSFGLYMSEIATVKFRYKEPNASTSKLIEHIILNSPEIASSNDFKFIQSVIEFGLIMRQSQYAGTANFDAILERASQSLGDDQFGYRREFMRLVEQAKLLSNPSLE